MDLGKVAAILTILLAVSGALVFGMLRFQAPQFAQSTKPPLDDAASTLSLSLTLPAVPEGLYNPSSDYQITFQYPQISRAIWIDIPYAGGPTQYVYRFPYDQAADLSWETTPGPFWLEHPQRLQKPEPQRLL